MYRMTNLNSAFLVRLARLTIPLDIEQGRVVGRESSCWSALPGTEDMARFRIPVALLRAALERKQRQTAGAALQTPPRRSDLRLSVPLARAVVAVNLNKKENPAGAASPPLPSDRKPSPLEDRLVQLCKQARDRDQPTMPSCSPAQKNDCEILLEMRLTPGPNGAMYVTTAPGRQRSNPTMSHLTAESDPSAHTAAAEPVNKPKRAGTKKRGRHTKGSSRRAAKSKANHQVRKTKPEGTNNKAQVIALMKRPKGATLAAIVALTGWQNHTVRGFVSILGRNGDKIESFKNPKGERTYKMAR